MEFKYGRDLVSDVVDQWVGAIPGLLDSWHRNLRYRWHMVWYTGHMHAGSNEVNVECRALN